MSEQRRRLVFGALGLVFIALLGAMGWFAVAIYGKAFSSGVPVVLRAERAGTQLKENADVKVRGVLVGSVRSIDVKPGWVDVELAMDPDRIHDIPANVSARLLPKTLFGQRYVSLVIPPLPAPRALSAGAVIQEDRSTQAVEVEQALRDLLPVLQTVQPQKLASTLGAVSQALEGRGPELGTTLVSLGDYLGRLNPEVPELRTAITKLADTVHTYSTAAPDLVDAMADLRTTATTLTRQQQDLAALFTTVTAAGDDAHGFLDANDDTLVDLSADSRPVLDLLAEYSPEIPCVADAAARLKPVVERALGAGTAEPGLHVDLTVRPPKPGGAPPPAADGPRCPTAGSAAPGADTPAAQRFLAELLAPVLGERPSEIPGWSGLLMNPLLRGAEVTLK
ncbi:MCE family protein [Amycolatopsis thermoflava]|uniref:MCE family protein n=1 Tax=Amycolatopsis thermoflava TaxID=84480 RepID=UPI00364771CF